METTKPSCAVVDDQYPKGTVSFHSFDDQLEGRLSDCLKSCQRLKPGDARTFHNLSNQYSLVTIVGINQHQDYESQSECLDVRSENVRVAIAGLLLAYFCYG